ncbi:MAG TPA: fluoride efflux transporter CrcB [Chondromyces sp.]|nr:fluoride efflux transporter CrcB [Chondromyces sp.]
MNIWAVGAGGFAGAILRYLAGKWIPLIDGFPLGTLFVNLVGCFFLAWFFTITTRKWTIPPALKLSIGTGILGSFTTFSTFSLETVHLLQQHYYYYALCYVLLSTIGGIAFAIIGAKLGSLNTPPDRKLKGESK